MGRMEKLLFGTFLAELRKRKNITLEQLCEGLCSVSAINRFEKGERMPQKLLKDRLLARLGEAPNGYEQCLFPKEYIRWERRQRLLNWLIERDVEKARQAMEEYREEYDMSDCLERQFCLAMEAQLGCYEGLGEDQLGKIFEEAVKLTVPGADHGKLAGMALSVQELNLMLEYKTRAGAQGLKEWYEEVAAYIDASCYDPPSRAKIYPKAAFYLCRNLMEMEGGSPEACIRCVELCDKAMEMLRETERLYYLWELLDIRSRASQRMEKWLLEHGRPANAAKLAVEGVRAEEWKMVLESIYEEYQIPKETQEYAYLYIEKEVYCISDIVRIRRKMLGMPKSAFGDICDARTLIRLEKGESRMQIAILKKIFGRLGLSGELYRANVVTSSPEAILLVDKLNKYSKERNDEREEEILRQLEQLISMDIPQNKQMVSRHRVLNEWGQGKITDGEYIRKMSETIGLTLPLDAVLSAEEVYLTKTERNCLYNLSFVENDKNAFLQRTLKTLKKLCDTYEKSGVIGSFISMYEIFTDRLASYLGNQGRYEESDEFSRKTMEECLFHRRAYMLNSCIYNIAWNYRQRYEKSIPSKKSYDIAAGLHQCVSISRFCKMYKEEKFYLRKIGEWL